MPPRKSDAAKAVAVEETTPTKEGKDGKEPKDTGKDNARDTISIEDLNLPRSIVTRLAKGVLPPNTQVQGNAMLAMTKSATVFVNYLASHANEYAQRENRKALTPQDVLRALEDLEFPDFKPKLEAELAKFNEIQADKRINQRNKVAANKASGKVNSPEADEVDNSLVERDGQPAAKKARREPVDVDTSRADDQTGDEGEDVDDVQGDEVDDEDETEGEEDERGEDEQLEDHEQGHEEEDDEALDNGEDSE